jgi:hypothetical protein
MLACRSAVRRYGRYYEDGGRHPRPCGVERKLAPLFPCRYTQLRRGKPQRPPDVEGHCEHPGEGRQEEVLCDDSNGAARPAANLKHELGGYRTLFQR